MNINIFIYFTFLSNLSLMGQIKDALLPIKWPSNTITVCWEGPPNTYQQEKDWVKEAIINTWQKESQLKFTEWCPCKENMKGIRIAIRDEKAAPHVNALGARIDGMHSGMVLNFTFNKWGRSLLTDVIRDRRKTIQSIAVHEFGHALGFVHQQDRRNCFICQDETNTTKFSNEPSLSQSLEGLWYTPCDRFSVMNYCASDYLNLGRLSDLDRRAVAAVYGTTRISEVADFSLEYTEKKTNKKVKIATMTGNVYKRDGTIEQHQEMRKQYDIIKGQYYYVKIYLVAPKNMIDKIDHVDYDLDQSMSYSLVQSRNRLSNYAITFFAWGNFRVSAKIYLTNQVEPIIREIQLSRIPPVLVKVKSRGALFGKFVRIGSKDG